MEAICLTFPTIIKASQKEGKRLVEVQASSEDCDQEGDVILQRALLNSAESFIKNGHIDIDHVSEIGHRYGIANPDAYIIGYPTEVRDKGKGRTFVEFELLRDEDDEDGTSLYNFVWKSLHTKPPMRWSASIYGFPIDGEWEDCSEETCEGTDATRYLVKGLRWKSLALTRQPVNNHLKGFARIVKSSFYAESVLGLMKDQNLPKEGCSCQDRKKLKRDTAPGVGMHQDTFPDVNRRIKSLADSIALEWLAHAIRKTAQKRGVNKKFTSPSYNSDQKVFSTF